MLSIKEIYKLLEQNELEARTTVNSSRLSELALHRAELKEELIKALEAKVMVLDRDIEIITTIGANIKRRKAS